MHPSRPPFSADPHAASRTALASIEAHLFSYAGDDIHPPPEALAQNEWYFSEALQPRSHLIATGGTSAPRNLSNPPANAANEINMIFQFLRDNRMTSREFLYEITIENRLNALHLSPSTLLSAIQIIHNPNHATLRALRLNNNQINQILNELLKILTQNTRLSHVLVSACQNANDNPDQLVTSIFRSFR